MSSSGVNFESYLIPLEEINRATENFSQQRCIGAGGFGVVYKGELSKRWQNLTVAIKRLDQYNYQGKVEFHNQLEMISKFHHKNIISFIGYCDEHNQQIIVYEYASNGSLDHHLQDPDKRCCITWIQRLKICLGAARGLHYLHSGLGKRVIHGDVKSANILLDGNLVAKIGDFGLSKVGSRIQRDTQLYTRVAGTQYYLDPTYYESGILRKESDVYSFGVVLFEILSGMLVYLQRSFRDAKQPSLMNYTRKYSQELEKLIDPHIRDQIYSRSFHIFSQIAYQCISLDLKERPTMEMVIQRIEEALHIQMEVNATVLCECLLLEDGFSYGKPVAAYTIYKCLLHWKTLEDERTPVFDKLIHIILSAIEDGDDNNQMAYWISNASTLIFLIQESLKKRVAMASHSSVSSGTLAEAEDAVQQVEAKYPVLLFQKRLIAYVEKMYDVILSNMNKELGSLIALCMQDPSRSEGVLISGPSFGKDSHFNHWQGIVDCLNSLLNTLKENFVPQKIVQKIFTQSFSSINVKIFNSLLLRPESCSFKNGEYVKSGLLELELWCSQAKEQILSLQQLHRMCTLYWDENANTPRVSQDVISIMRILMTEESSNSSGNSFLIEDRSSVTFSVDDLTTSLQVKDYANVKPSAELSKNPTFQFLYN
ncbi:myosin-6 isoform X2 [Lactuca sativa]|uniref:myosin-6 isoform X2 n=1 Tax=Lactuca sativa TaxID=4236 RepID=UPI001C68B5F3|nr:myosin-6 isoform X2 [Lactuca sativa]